MHNKITKIAYIVIGAYMLLSFVLPFRRIVVNWTEAQQQTWVPIFFSQTNALILIGAIAVLLLRFPNSRTEHFLDKIVSKTLIPVTAITLAACLALTFLRVSGQWWTWQTLGIHIATITLIALLLRKRLSPMKALAFSAGCVLFVVGIWEMIYQCGLYYYWLEPQGIAVRGLTWQLQIMSPFVLVGILIIYNYNRVYHVFSANVPMLAFSALFIGAFAYWFLNGFWCDQLYDVNTNSWYLNPESNYLSMSVYRSSKVWFALIFASACTSIPMLKIRELCLQPGYCKKEENK